MGNGALRYAQRELFLVGKYLIIPNPTDLAIRHLHLDPKQAFTPDLQNLVFSCCLIATRQRTVRDPPANRRHRYTRHKPDRSANGPAMVILFEATPATGDDNHAAVAVV